MGKAGVEVVDYLYLLGSQFLLRINLSKFMETGIPPPVELVGAGDVDKRYGLIDANGTRYFDVDYKLHCVGGERYDEEEHTRCYSDRVFTFDPHTHNPVLATNIPPLNAPKCIPQTATVDGKIYVLSASPFVCDDQPPPGPVFEVFDPSLNAWEDLPTLPYTVFGHLLHFFVVWEREIVICTNMGLWSFDTVARSWRHGSSFKCWSLVCASPGRGSFVALRNKYLFSLSPERGLVAFHHSNSECFQVIHDFNALLPVKLNSFSGFFIHHVGSAGEAEERLCAVITSSGKAMVSIFRVVIDQAGESCRVIIDYTHTFECEVLHRVRPPHTFISHQRQTSQKVENSKLDVSSEMSRNVLRTAEVGIMLSSPLAIPERLGTDKNIEIQKMEKLIKALESARGNGASMISLILPARDQISLLIKMLEDEYGTVSNITGRDSHQLGAITLAQQRLKLYDNVLPNGLVLHIATIVTEGGEEKITFDFEPFMPVNASLYLCDKKFRAEALNGILEYDRFGFIVIGKNGSLFGTLSGNTREVVHQFYVDIPQGRYGPHSRLRFAYKRRLAIHNFVRKTAEVATEFYIDPATCLPNVSGLILAGKSNYHTQLSQSDMFDSRLKAKILNVVDVSCEGESGFNQAIELSSEIIPHVKFIQEKRVMNVYFWG